MFKQWRDQAGINFQWQFGAQFQQGKRASYMIRCATIPLLLQTVKIDFLVYCNHFETILEFVCNA